MRLTNNDKVLIQTYISLRFEVEKIERYLKDKRLIDENGRPKDRINNET